MNDLTPLMIGTLGSEALLSGPMARRQALAARIEAAGLDHVFIADHISFHTGIGMDGLIQAAILTTLLPATEVCIGVYLLALRHPVPVARQLSTLSESAPGRVVLGVGVGGEDRHEIEICGVDPGRRGARTDHCLAALEGLLSGEATDHDSDFFSFHAARIRPAPTPRIPILIGGRADAALARCARFGDGWLGVWTSAARFGAAVKDINARADALGRPAPNAHGMQIWCGFDSEPDQARQRLATRMEGFYKVPFESFERYSPYGRPADVAAALKPYLDAGCRRFNLMPVAASEEAGIEAVAEVASLLRKDPDSHSPLHGRS